MIGNHQRRIGNQTKAERARQLARLLIDKEKLKTAERLQGRARSDIVTIKVLVGIKRDNYPTLGKS